MDATMQGMIPEDPFIRYFDKPAFRKLCIDGLNFCAVRIPTAFLGLMEENVPDTAILNGSSGGCWCIEVVKEEEGISLENGWEKFRDDNKLAQGDVLLFRYSGNWCFDIEIFGPDGLEKRMKDFEEKGKGIQQRKENLYCDDEFGKNSRAMMNIKKTIAYSRQSKEAGPSVIGRRGGKPIKENVLAPNKQVNKSSSLDRANWKDPKVSKLFIDLCLEELATGRTDKGNMTSKSWENIRLAFEGKNIDLTTEQLRNHWTYQKRKYMIWSKIVTEAGETHYNPQENKINWSGEQWERYIEGNPEARQFANKSLDYPIEMMLLFDD